MVSHAALRLIRPCWRAADPAVSLFRTKAFYPLRIHLSHFSFFPSPSLGLPRPLSSHTSSSYSSHGATRQRRKFRKVASASALRIRESAFSRGRTVVRRARTGFSRFASQIRQAAVARGRLTASKIRLAARRKGTAIKDAGKSRTRALFDKYGFILVGTYFSLWVTTLSSFFVSIEYGIFSPKIMAGGVNKVNDTVGDAMDTAVDTLQDAIGMEHGDIEGNTAEKDDETTITKYLDYLEKYEFMGPLVEKVKADPTLMNLGIAIVLTKMTEPLRIGITIALLPRIARMLGRKAPKMK